MNTAAIETGAYLSAAGQPFNVRLFGAKGDGLTDDTAAIQAAIDAALNSGKGAPMVLLPAGRYLVNQHLENPECLAGRLVLGASHGGRFHLRGEGGATLCSTEDFFPDGELDFLLAVWSPSYADVLIENLCFERQPAAIGRKMVCAIATNGATGVRIAGCTFRDFCPGLLFWSAICPSVSGCRWIYTDGINCGRGSSGDGYQPNVGLRCDNCQDARVLDNYWCGTENGTQPMDGFLWGSSQGWTVRGNTVRRAWVEGIYLVATSQSDPARAALVEGNRVDCEPPAGCDPVLARTGVRMAIRVDDHGAVIRGNAISKSRSPICCNNHLPPTAPGIGAIISSNLMVFDPVDTAAISTAPSVLYGILLLNRKGAIISDNQILFPANAAGNLAKGLPAAGITLAAATQVDIHGNTVYAFGPPAAGQDVFGLYDGGGNGAVVAGNRFQNLSQAVGKMAATVASVQVGTNSLFSIPQAT